MNSPFGELGLQLFLDRYWQKQPCLIRQAFPGFEPELDADDVAGLACDELAESRLITGRHARKDWSQRFGPFSEKELRNLPESNWTLLVQDVEKHYPPLQSLLRSFDFLPGWRLDDLMISVASPGGSVGPHFDQYDVFLLQASGSRRWQIASSFDPTLLPHCELNVLASFEPEQEWDLTAGDMLYLPPGVAHHGVALDNCMTWSIGLRAPSQADLLLAFGEWLAEKHQEGNRYQDGQLDVQPRPGEISKAAAQDLLSLLTRPPGSAHHLNEFIGTFLTRFRLAQQPAPPDRKLRPADIATALTHSAILQRNPWTRLAWIEQDGQARLFAAGEEFCCSIDIAESLCAFPPALSEADSRNSTILEIVCQLVNAGHLYLET